MNACTQRGKVLLAQYQWALDEARAAVPGADALLGLKDYECALEMVIRLPSPAAGQGGAIYVTDIVPRDCPIAGDGFKPHTSDIKPKTEAEIHAFIAQVAKDAA